MTEQHPITPPPELVKQWAYMLEQHTDTEVFTAAARWGADQELEACCKTLEDIWNYEGTATLNDFLRALRAARRPTPQSLKRLALDQLKALELHGALDCNVAHIRRALEALPND